MWQVRLLSPFARVGGLRVWPHPQAGSSPTVAAHRQRFLYRHSKLAASSMSVAPFLSMACFG
jgi:hypothetical protein